MPVVTPLPAPLDGPALQALGFALFHFLWQGALIGALLWAALRLLNRASSRLRYGVSCLALTAMLAVPAVTGAGLWRHLTAEAAVADEIAADETSAPASPQPALAEADVRPAVDEPPVVDVMPLVWPYLPYLAAAWSVGASLLLLRLLGGWGYARYLATRTARPASGEWQARLDALARRMDVRRPVRLRVTAGEVGPCVIGWRRPVILVPARVLATLPAWQVEAVLAHELAHIRRHDVLVNGWQSAAEALLFYHPAVWWTSRQIRAEREHGCDDRGAALCGSATAYARALVALEAFRQTSAPFALAATDGPLLGRIRRLVAPAPPRRGGFASAALASVLVLSAGVLVTACADVITDGPPEGVEGTSVQIEEGVLYTADGVLYRSKWRPYDFPANSDMKVSLSGNYGGVGLADSTWSRSGKRVVVELRGFAETAAEAEQIVRDVRISRQDGGLRIEGPKSDSARRWTALLTKYKPATPESSAKQTHAPDLRSYRERRPDNLPDGFFFLISGGSVTIDRDGEIKLEEPLSITIEAFAETEAEARRLARDVRITQEGKVLRIDGPKSTDTRRWTVRFGSSGRVD